MIRYKVRLGVLALAMMAILSFASKAAAEESSQQKRDYFAIDVAELVTGAGKSNIVSDPEVLQASFYQMETTPRVVVPSGVEAYLIEPESRSYSLQGYKIIGARPLGSKVDGQLYVMRSHPEQEKEGTLMKFDFHVDENPDLRSDKSSFYRAKGRYFQLFWSRDYAGTALFRYLAIDSLRRVGETARPIGPSWPMQWNNNDTIGLLSGGRAVSENLQLDRELNDVDSTDSERKDLSTVEGITIREINWKGRLSSEATELDPLAGLIPPDQYAVFVPSFAQLVQIVERGNELARPFVQWFETQSQATDTLGFYQDQLGLQLDALTRQVGGALISEVAVTGSDPYFRTGTDLAVLMQTKQPALLHQAILALVASRSNSHANVVRTDHQMDGHSIVQWSNPHRDFCSVVAVVDGSVIVSNSLHQMTSILNIAKDPTQAMKGLDEYKFFRQRYRRGESQSALIVITDAAIRRWCSPIWRISASRRTRARAMIAEYSMRNADQLVTGTIKGETQLPSDATLYDAGVLTLNAGGVRSDRYGTLDFQTPIAELDLKTGTSSEVALYVQWRDRYQSRWRNVFDPIAIELSLQKEVFAVDLSVIPLILGSDYAIWKEMIGNVHLKPGAGDRHDEELASLATALDLNSRYFAFARTVLGGDNANFNLLNWIDDAAYVYVDRDDEWMQRIASRSPWDLSQDGLFKDLPLALFVPSKDSLKQALFIASVRAFLDRSAPNLLRWEVIKHEGMEFVQATAVGSTPVGKAEDMPKLYYVTLPKGVTLSFSEHVVRRAIDRHLKSEHAAPADIKPADETAVDFETQIETRISGTGTTVLASINQRAGMNRTQRLSWGNIPVLNYLRHQYPDYDPMSVYRQLFGQTLIEPSGGEYVWDDSVGTFVSTLHGEHLQPKAGPVSGLPIQPSDLIETTLSFQDDGLRATLKLKTNEE